MQVTWVPPATFCYIYIRKEQSKKKKKKRWGVGGGPESISVISVICEVLSCLLGKGMKQCSASLPYSSNQHIVSKMDRGQIDQFHT